MRQVSNPQNETPYGRSITVLQRPHILGDQRSRPAPEVRLHG
jgi:hypothetical protein